MTEDFIDSTFSDLDDFYPGSKRKRKAVSKKTTEVYVAPAWDINPKIRTLPNGKDVEMFGIGALALALGRPIITLRAWIKDGNVPSAPYRLPSTKDVNGKDHPGKRLYSRAMIEAAVTLFANSGALDTKRIEWSKYRNLSNEIAEAWDRIRADETK